MCLWRAVACVSGERREESDLVEALPADTALVPTFRVFNAHEYNCVRNNFLRAGFLRQHSGDEWCVGGCASGGPCCSRRHHQLTVRQCVGDRHGSALAS